MQQCPYCSTPVDAVAAQAAAELMSKVNQGCSDASYLRIVAGLMGVFFVVSFVPLISWLGTAGYWFMIFAVPVMAVRWRFKYGKLKTDDPGFKSAKKLVLVAVGIWALLAVVGLGLSMIRVAATTT